MKLIQKYDIPIRTRSEANISEHWSKTKKIKDMQKGWVWIYLTNNKPKIDFPCHIKLIRVGKRILDPDNLPVSMKYIQDAVADIIIPGLKPGRADGDPRLSWEYAQEIGKFYGVKIELYAKE